LQKHLSRGTIAQLVIPACSNARAVTSNRIKIRQHKTDWQMKTTILQLTIAFFCSTFTYGQTEDSLKTKIKHEASMDLCAFYTPILSNDFFGCNFDFKYYPRKKIATGLNASITQKKISDTFSYSIGKPFIEYYEFGWINQYDFLQSDRIRIGV
jgi:hypothetical protein